MAEINIAGRLMACLREASKLTQEELARRIGVKRESIAQMESGKHRLTANHFIKAVQELLVQAPLGYYELLFGAVQAEDVLGEILAGTELPEERLRHPRWNYWHWIVRVSRQNRIVLADLPRQETAAKSMRLALVDPTSIMVRLRNALFRRLSIERTYNKVPLAFLLWARLAAKQQPVRADEIELIRTALETATAASRRDVVLGADALGLRDVLSQYLRETPDCEEDRKLNLRHLELMSCDAGDGANVLGYLVNLMHGLLEPEPTDRIALSSRSNHVELVLRTIEDLLASKPSEGQRVRIELPFAPGAVPRAGLLQPWPAAFTKISNVLMLKHDLDALMAEEWPWLVEASNREQLNARAGALARQVEEAVQHLSETLIRHRRWEGGRDS